MKPSMRWSMLALVLVGAAVLIGGRYNSGMAQARARVAEGSVLLQTRCGPTEVQEAGSGVPLMVVHGSGGGRTP